MQFYWFHVFFRFVLYVYCKVYFFDLYCVLLSNMSLFSQVVLKAGAASCSQAADGSSLNSGLEESTTSSCFSICQDSLATHHQQSPRNSHFLPCPVIKFEALACTICNCAATGVCLTAGAGGFCCSLCTRSFSYGGWFWRVFNKQTGLDT